MGDTLLRSAPLEVRLNADGRTLNGVALRYGDVAPRFAERVERGAFVSRSEPLPLRLMHDVSRTIATTSDTLRIRDTPEALIASTPLRTDSAELGLVQRGRLNGLSVEMTVLAERREDGLRVIERAHLLGVGLVDAPAYRGSRIELRARWSAGARMARIASRVPTGKRLQCECSDGASFAEFTADAFRSAVADIKATGAEVTAALNSYDNTVASTSKGTLRLGVDNDGALRAEIDIVDTPTGHAVLDADHDSGLIVRPFVDDPTGDGSELVSEGEETFRRWNAPRLRSIMLTTTDAREGWPLPVVTVLDEPEPRMSPQYRKALAWL
ncbi:HK97 family phage prohead protease [Candidatus Poriferisodalis sp.]|uniref:HK97 family phage prohead protease n=1 Tax=Candidatus Poriferisodalis sp. TaxID=3101277 RepID=UPI003B01E51A